MDRGQTVLMPAELTSWTIEGPCRYVRFYVPDLRADIIDPLRDRGVSDDDIRRLGGDPDTGDVAIAMDR